MRNLSIKQFIFLVVFYKDYMKIYLSMLIIIIFGLSVFGQAKKTTVKPTPTPVKKVEAVTQTNETKPTQKVIVEKVNGDRLTGLFVGGDTESITIDISGVKLPVKLTEIKAVWLGEVSEKPTQDSTKTQENSNLSVEAAIIYRSGEVVPIARTTFYLLDEDAITILRNAGVQPTQMTSRVERDYAKAIYTDLGFSARYGSLPEYQKFISDFVIALKPHIKYSFDTDFTGKALLSNVPKGKYYLFSIASTRQSGIVWNLAIDTDLVKNLVLDTKNAAFAY